MSEFRHRVVETKDWREAPDGLNSSQEALSEFTGASKRTSTGKKVNPGNLDLTGLVQAVETDIIPKLVLAHRYGPAKAQGFKENSFSEEVAAFGEMILSHDVETACAHIEVLRMQGQSLETIYFNLLAPTANYLRHICASDFCSYADATLAFWRLQQVLREFSVVFRAESARKTSGRRALLVPARGEKRELGFLMFGLVMIGEFLRRDGWESWIEADPASSEFTQIVRGQWFDVVEFMITGERNLDVLASDIRMVRKESPNKTLGVVLCGQVFVEHPELVLMVGGDSGALDARQGVLQANNLTGLLTSRD